MVQQLTKEGNILSLLLKASPTGLMHTTVCKLYLHCSTKKSYKSDTLLSLPTRFALGLTISRMLMISSFGYKFGISPVLRMLLMSSMNDSSLTWESVKRKTVGEPSPPLFLRMSLRSSLHSMMP